jgi:hypothetical protein
MEMDKKKKKKRKKKKLNTMENRTWIKRKLQRRKECMDFLTKRYREKTEEGMANKARRTVGKNCSSAKLLRQKKKKKKKKKKKNNPPPNTGL